MTPFRFVVALSLVWAILFLAPLCVVCFHRQPCSRHHSLDFSFPDCYLPDQDDDLMLSDASFVMAHDAATGYISFGISKTGLSTPYSKTQVGTLYEQLNNGARALDLRPWLYANGTVIFHHGTIKVPILFEDGIQEVIRWVDENPGELVLLLTSHFGYENSNQYDEDPDAMVSALATIYNSSGISYFACEDIYGWTVAQAKQAAAVVGSRGSILAVDRNDFGGDFCGKQNYIESEIVTCWDANNHTSCKDSEKPWKRLKAYTRESANGAPSDDNSQLGPPKSWDTYPFNEIQAFWQVDLHAIAMGLAHFSSIIEDNLASNINAKFVDLIYEGKFDGVSLLAVDNVAAHGNALSSVLRNACGQSVLDKCGKKVPKPPMKRWRITKVDIISFILLGYIVFMTVLFFYRRPKLVSTIRARISGQGNERLQDEQPDAIDDDGKRKDLLKGEESACDFLGIGRQKRRKIQEIVLA